MHGRYGALLAVNCYRNDAIHVNAVEPRPLVGCVAIVLRTMPPRAAWDLLSSPSGAGLRPRAQPGNKSHMALVGKLLHISL